MPATFTGTDGTHLDEWKLPKPRSALGYYLAVWVTGGLFIFVWLYLLLRDINRLSRKRLLNAPALVGSALGLVLFNQAFLVYGSIAFVQTNGSSWFFRIGFTVALAALLELIAIVTLAYRHAVLANRGRVPSGSLVGITLLSFLWFASLPLTQAELNRAIRRSTSARA
jgi:hypothetical protein